MAGNRPSPLTYIPVWERAFAEEIGFGFTVTNMPREQFRAILYEARKMSGDPRLDELILFAPNAPCDKEIWICKKAVELDSP